MGLLKRRQPKDSTSTTGTTVPTPQAGPGNAAAVAEAPAEAPPSPTPTLDAAAADTGAAAAQEGGGASAFAAAEVAYAAGNFAGAIPLYLEAWETSDLAAADRGQIAWNLGQAHRKCARYEPAVAWYETAIESGAAGIDEEVARKHIATCKRYLGEQAESQGAFQRAEAAYAKGRWSEAVVLYEEVWSTPGLDGQSRGQIAYNIAQAYRKQSLLAKAVSWYERALAEGGAAIASRKAEIEEHLKTCKARLGVDDTTQTPPDAEHAQDVFRAAEEAYAAKRYVEALDGYLAAWGSMAGGRSAAIAFDIGQCYRLLGDAGRAATWYRTALDMGGDELGADRAVIEEMLAKVTQEFEETDPKTTREEKSDRKAGSEAQQKAVEESFREAEALYAGGKYAAALPLYMEVWASQHLAGQRGLIAFNIGQCHKLLGQNQRAIAWYEAALAAGVGADEDAVRRVLDEVRGGSAAA